MLTQNWLQESSALFAHVDRTVEPVDHEEILEERLVRYEFMRETTTNDQNCVGDCLLRAVSRHVYGTDAHQADVRRTSLAMLILNRHIYHRFLQGEDWDHYIHRVSRADEDVDVAFTRAITDVYALRIIELIPFKDQCIVEYIPSNKRIIKNIGIATYVHTDAMYDIEEGVADEE
ncbi:hypothetical protein Tco_1038485 [Tanacetum coccineum]